MVYNSTEEKFKEHAYTSLVMSGTTNDSINIMDKFIKCYKTCPDIIIGSNVDILFDKTKPFPDIINISELKDDNEFVQYVINFEYPDGFECCINFEKHQYIVANAICMHDVSFKTYLF